MRGVLGVKTIKRCRQLIAVPLIAVLASLQICSGLPAVAATSVLTPGAFEAATLLGILPKVERLIQLNQLSRTQDSLSDEELALKVDVLDKVMGGSLEVRMVSGRIDRELAWAFAGQGMLQGRRQRNLNYLFTLNFMQGGILGTLSGPAFLSGEPKTGTELLLLASSIGLTLSTLSLLAGRSGTKKIDGGTTILADVFHLPQPTPDHNPEIVLKFLNSVPPQSASPKTRIETLVGGWKSGHYLHSTSEGQLEKLAVLLPPTDKHRENIGLIASRIRMLFDTQHTVEQLDAELLDLLRVVDQH